MKVKITSKRRVTFPRHVLEKMRVKEGDFLSIVETEDGFLIRPGGFDKESLAPLHEKISAHLPAPDLESLRHAALNPILRD